MKLRNSLAIIAATTLINVSSLPAFVLNDFDQFATSGAYDSPFFSGSWEGQGIQNLDGTYDIGGDATNDALARVDFYFPEAVDFSAQSYLVVSVRLLPDNEASSFTFQLVDSNGLTALARFDTSLFNISDYVSVAVPFVFDFGFDATSVEQWTLSGGIPGGSDRFGVSFDSAVTAVPEPAMLGLLVLGGAVAFLRRSARRQG